MGYVIVLFIFFVGGGWLIGRSLGNSIAPGTDHVLPSSDPKPPNITVHNHHKHIHVSKKELKDLHESKF